MFEILRIYPFSLNKTHDQKPQPTDSYDANKPILENQSFKDEVKNTAFLSMVSDFASDLTNKVKKQDAYQKECKNERAISKSETEGSYTLSTAECERSQFPMRVKFYGEFLKRKSQSCTRPFVFIFSHGFMRLTGVF